MCKPIGNNWPEPYGTAVWALFEAGIRSMYQILESERGCKCGNQTVRGGGPTYPPPPFCNAHDLPPEYTPEQEACAIQAYADYIDAYLSCFNLPKPQRYACGVEACANYDAAFAACFAKP